MDEPEVVSEEDLIHVELCPSCKTQQIHSILTERDVGGGVDYRTQCEGCSHVHLIQVRPPKGIKVKFTLSDGPHSSVHDIDVDDDETIHLDDVFDFEEKLWRVSQLHLIQEQAVRSAEPHEVVSAWAVRCDLVRIKITMTEGETSKATVMECEPGEIFACGSIMEFEGRKWRIRAIHTGLGRTLTGKKESSQIRRIFLHPPPEPRKHRFRRE